MSNVWEFNEELDTAKSFQAFSIYRDLGPNRTIDDAFYVYRERPRGASRAPGYFDKWAIKGKWVDRAKQFDLENNRLRLIETSSESRQKHEDRLEQVRAITENIAIARLTSSLNSAVLVRDTIAHLKGKCQQGKVFILDKPQADFLLVLLTIQNKDASTIEASLKLADEALGIQGLLDRIGGE